MSAHVWHVTCDMWRDVTCRDMWAWSPGMWRQLAPECPNKSSVNSPYINHTQKLATSPGAGDEETKSYYFTARWVGECLCSPHWRRLSPPSPLEFPNFNIDTASYTILQYYWHIFHTGRIIKNFAELNRHSNMFMTITFWWFDFWSAISGQDN